MSNTYLGIIILFMIGAFQSCQTDRFDPENLSNEINATPFYEAPLLNAKIKLKDILKERQDTVTYYADEDGYGDMIKVHHAVDSLYTMHAEDYLEELPVIEPITKSHVLGLLPRDGYFEDQFSETIEFDSLVKVYFDPIDREDYATYDGSSINAKNQTQDLSLKAKPFFLPFPNIRSAEFGQGTITATVTNNFDVPISFDLVLASNSGGWKELRRFEFDNSIPVSGTDSDVMPAQGIVLEDVRKQSFGYYLENITLGAKTGGTVDITKNLNIQFQLDKCKMVRGIVKLPESQQRFDADSSTFFEVTVYKDKQLHDLVIRKGYLDYSIESSFERPIAVQLNFPGIFNQGEQFKTSVVATENQQIDNKFSLEGLHIDLTQHPDTPYNRLKVDLNYHLDAGSGWIEFDSSDAISATFHNADSLQFEWARGNLGIDTIDIDQESLDYNLSELFDDFFTGEILFTDPKLEIRIDNSVGVTGALDLFVDGEGKDGVTVPLFYDSPGTRGRKFDVQGPDYPYKGESDNVVTEIKKDTIKLNRDNSQIVKFIGNLPEKLNYSGKVITNFENINKQDQIENVVTYDAVTNVGMEAILPLNFTMKDLTLRRYFKSEVSDVLSLNDYENIEPDELTLFFDVDNQFPFDVKLVYTLLDTIGEDKTIDTLHVSMLHSSDPDGNGGVRQGVFNSYKDKVVLKNSGSDTILTNFLNADMIVVDVVLNTANGGDTEVKLYTHYELNLKMMVGLKTRIKATALKPEDQY